MTTPVILHNKEKFEALLNNYKISDHARKVLSASTLVVRSGVAGGGRNTIINQLTVDSRYTFLVSDTTRPPKLRNGNLELHGINYFFRSEQDMLRDIEQGEFVEAELIHNQQVSGTSIREVARAAEAGHVAVVEIEYGGVRNVALAKPDAYIIGVLPPSYDEWLRRLRDREDIHKQEFSNRLSTAEKVLVNMLEHPYFQFVINDTVDDAVKEIKAIVDSGITDDIKQLHGRQVAQDMLNKVQNYLSK